MRTQRGLNNQRRPCLAYASGKQLLQINRSKLMSIFNRIRSFGYSLAGSTPELIGVWERTGDNFAGCTVVISNSNEGFSGYVTSVPPAMQRCGWLVGDKKWINFHSRSRTSWTVSDLAKQYDIERLVVTDAVYTKAPLNFVADDCFGLKSDRHTSTTWIRAGQLDSANP